METDLMLKEINWKTEDIKAATMAKSDELAQLKEARRLREVFRLFSKYFFLDFFFTKTNQN